MNLKSKNNIVVIIGELLDMTMILILTVAFAVITGCGEEDEESVNPLTANALKQFEEAAPAAPTAPNAGIPSVKEVGYYSDWKLTKNITGVVKPGSTIFLKVVFSEPMRLKVADDETARPILYYRLNGKLNRFRIAKHGSGGKNFVSGDAKPLGRSSDVYICKYIVPANMKGELVAAVGKLSTDRDGNTLTEFYTHTEKLSIGQKAKGPTVGQTTKVLTQPPVETPAVKEQEPATDITPLAVLSIEYYLDGDGEVPIDPETQFVWVGTSVFTKVVFSKPVTPVINSTIDEKEKRYRVVPRGETHELGTCQPVNAEETVFLCSQSALEEAFSITVTTDSADRDGNTLAEAVRSPILEVRQRPTVPQPTPKPAPRTTQQPAPQPTPEPQETTPQPTSAPQPTPKQPTPAPQPLPPVPVELSSFSPVRNKETGTVVITWLTQSELNNAGFFIKRSQQRDGEFKVINSVMIPGAGTTSEKQSYTYEDTTAQPNVVYYYQIEDVSLDGDRQTLTRGVRLRGHVGVAGKATTTWGDLKTSNE